MTTTAEVSTPTPIVPTADGPFARLASLAECDLGIGGAHRLLSWREVADTKQEGTPERRVDLEFETTRGRFYAAVSYNPAHPRQRHWQVTQKLDSMNNMLEHPDEIAPGFYLPQDVLECTDVERLQLEVLRLRKVISDTHRRRKAEAA